MEQQPKDWTRQLRSCRNQYRLSLLVRSVGTNLLRSRIKMGLVKDYAELADEIVRYEQDAMVVENSKDLDSAKEHLKRKGYF